MVFIVVGLCLALFIAAFYATFRLAVSRMLAQSEEIQVREQQAVISGRFEDDCSTLRLQAQDIAFWDETLLFAQGENPDYLTDNLPAASPVLTYQTTFMLVKDAQGADILSEFRDPATREELSLPVGLSLALNPFVQTGVAQYNRSIPR